MADSGWIKFYKKTFENPVVMKDADHLAIWTWLLLKAAWKESDVLFDDKRITLKPGTLPPVSRRTIASELHISESKVQRVLKRFENEHQIEQQMGNKSRLISIVSWDEYQQGEHQSERQVNTKRTTSEPQVNTIEEYKNNKNNKNNNKYIYKGVPEELKPAFMDWVKMRERIKKPIVSEVSVTRALNKLDKLADTTEGKINLIELATERCWLSFYADKENDDETSKHNGAAKGGTETDSGYYGWAASGYKAQS